MKNRKLSIAVIIVISIFFVAEVSATGTGDKRPPTVEIEEGQSTWASILEFFGL